MALEYSYSGIKLDIHDLCTALYNMPESPKTRQQCASIISLLKTSQASTARCTALATMQLEADIRPLD